MAISHSSSSVMNGLVFYYDQNNIKSYKGPAIQNLAALRVIGSQSSTGFSSVPGSETVDIPQLGRIAVDYKLIQNDYPAVSTNCCPSLYTYSPLAGGFAVSPSTLYTYSIVYKCETGYTHPNYMYRYEYTANGGTLVTEAGIHNTSNRVELGNGWYWAWGTFTTQATTNWIAYSGLFYYRWVTTVDKVTVAKVLITPGNYTGLHPRYWPDPTTTRGSTQVLSDLISNNSITANSLTYASDGTFSFNGVDSYLDLGTTTQLTDNFTLSVWHINPNVGFIVDQGNIGVDPTGCLEWTNYGLTLSSNNNPGVITDTTGAANLITSRWNNVVCTFSAGTVKFYVNGELSYTTTAAFSSFSPGGNILKIGRRAFNTASIFSGTLGVVKVYNKVLSAGEVRQNFNALRGRYGL